MMNVRSAFSLILAILLFPAFSYGAESDCDTLKRVINSKEVISPESKKELFERLSFLIQKNENCAKNLLGRVYFEGVIIPQNKEKAQGIFYDLSEKDYPPALYNLAYFFINENKGDPVVNMDLLHGLMIKYSGDADWGYISANSRELGWDYLAKLEQSNISKEVLIDLKEQHKNITEKNINELAEAVKSRTKEVKSQSDSIMAVIAVGAAAVAITRTGMLAQGAGYTSNRLPVTMYLPSGSNPRFYQFMPTANSGILYGVPIY
jgi:hypothetical protein